MKLSSESFDDGQPIPEEFAFARIDPATHVALASNKNPQLGWSEVPEGTKSFVLICVDRDVPSKPDDVNQEGRTVPVDLPRGEFCHWAMVDIPVECTSIAAGECSEGVTAGGKNDPPGPIGSRQGMNDYSGWFAGDPNMGGRYMGYDGPGPPWNDERLHHYHFELYALDVDFIAVENGFQMKDVLAAIEGHVLAKAAHIGTYTLNPAL